VTAEDGLPGEVAWDVLRSTSDPVWLVDPAGGLLWANDAALGYLGLGSVDEVSKSLFECLPRDKAQHRRLMLNAARRTNESIEFVDFHQRWWQVSVRPTDHRDVFVFWQRDISRRLQAEEDLRRSLISAVTIQEDERRRISRDLHDETGQAITGLILELRELSRQLDDGDLRQRADRASAMAMTLMKQTRGLLHQLNPPSLKSKSLVSAMQDYCALFSERTEIRVVFDGAAAPLPLSDDRSTTLYRLLQESLTNVARHSNATKAWVSLAADDGEVTISVEDDGIGVDGDIVEGGGLRGIRERFAMLDGHVEVHVGSGRGIRIDGSIPMIPPAARLDREEGAQ
jgi:PAS domain S-box-containing protein